MKKEISAQELRDLYIEKGAIIEKANLEGDYKTNNKVVRELNKASKVFDNNIDLAKEVLFPLLDSTINFGTRVSAATDCLALNIYIKEAKQTLIAIKKDPSAKAQCLFAEISLDLWRKGKLTAYRKKDKTIGNQTSM